MKNSQQAGMLCGEGGFCVFLKGRAEIAEAARKMPDEKWLFLRTKEDAAIAVRYIFDIDSRRQLDEPQYAPAWRELVADYELWKRGI